MHAVKAILFDLDNTLIDRDAAVGNWLRATVSTESVEHLLAIDAGGDGDRREFFNAVARASNCPPHEARRAFIRELPGHIVPKTGLRPLLQRLANGRRLAVASNGSSAFQRAKMCASDLDESDFSEVFISQDIGVDKPDPKFFAAALERLGLPADEVLMVGDHPRKDIAGANACGLRTCWLRTARFSPPAEADWIVDELNGLALL